MIKSRLLASLRANQDPIDRLWAVVVVLSVLVFIIGGLVVENRIFSTVNRELDFQRGSVDCLSVAVDDDRSFGLPHYCELDSIVVYYPPEICEEYFPGRSECGYRWEE